MFRLPTHTRIAPGALSSLAGVVTELAATRVFFVSDQGMQATQWLDNALLQLATAGAHVESFFDVSPNPRAAEIDNAAEQANAGGADLVVALGGGSVMDAAKTVSMLLSNPGSCLDYEGKNRFSNPPVPFIAIPTTCGTGSEVTWVSVVSDPGSKRKISIKGNGMFPTVALVDADVLESLPSELIASTGLDALTHAMEALVSRLSNPASDALATRSILLILEHLEPCAADPTLARHREAMMTASTLAGMAFGNADVGAVHCLSESIGGLFDHPHGLLNAQLLSPVMNYQLPEISDRLGEVELPYKRAEMLGRIDALVGRLGIPSLRTLGIPMDSVGALSRLAESNNSNPSNPRTMTSEDYRHILTGLLSP